MTYFLRWNKKYILNYALVALFYAQEMETETGTFKTLKIKSMIKKRQFDKPLFTKNVDTHFSFLAHWWEFIRDKIDWLFFLFFWVKSVQWITLFDSQNWSEWFIYESNCSRFKDLKTDYQSIMLEMSFLVNGPFKTT